MTDKSLGSKNSVSDDLSFKKTIEILKENICDLYKSFGSPWIIGYSGGKDSTAVLQLIWIALSSLSKSELKYPIHIISTDTLVENPVVAIWVKGALEKMQTTGEKSGLPIFATRLTPELKDSFWVNLIGKGYPAPRPKFRWCTSRLKINPSNKFINNILKEGGEAILALGMRKAESPMRSMTMHKIEKMHGRVRKHLSPNTALPNCYVFTPIEDWNNDDVWLFLLENHITPWGIDNNQLLEFYKGATKDRECPMAITTGTTSCGDSRFGCWVCTMVDQDKSMQAMIQNDEEKEWMLPLLEYRDSFNIKTDRERRDFRRSNGNIMIYNDRAVHGPYWQNERKKLLRSLLEVQKMVKDKKPKDIPDFDIISTEELNEIRKIWNKDKDEIEDDLPSIYEDVMKKPFPKKQFDERSIFGQEEFRILKNICGDDILHYQLVRNLISQEQKFLLMAKRSGLFDVLEQIISKHFYEDERDATDRKKYFDKKRNELEKEPDQLLLQGFIKPIKD